MNHIAIIDQAVKEASSKYSELKMSDYKENSNFVSFNVNGGLNGIGNWRDYLSDILDLIDNLQENYQTVQIVDSFIDSLDDVFSFTIIVAE